MSHPLPTLMLRPMRQLSLIIMLLYMMLARVIVIVDDTNTAPFARSSTGAIINSTQPLAITIPEDQTAVGTER